jgi:alkanesulfonate monooxygenase SsuD/methylene tetrahydromethanopterin reductase-like flavin-dependent oxidoreductase (luciferase family)
MKFGLMAQIQMPRPWTATSEREAYWNALSEAEQGEAVGFDYFWLTEQHFYIEIGHSVCSDMFLAALSQRTERMRLGFGVMLLPCHHPFQVAEKVATLDVLSNGRAEFGFGRGTAPYIVEGFGVDADQARDLSDESIRAVLQMFKHERFPGFKGKYFDLPARQVIPRPVQQPHPPLWVAASNLDSWTRAAERGFGVIGVTRMPPEEVRPAVTDYWATVRDWQPTDCYGSFANPHAGAFAIAYCDEDDRIGREVACSAARWYYGQNDAELNRLRFGSAVGIQGVMKAVESRTDDELIDDALVVGGNPDTCARVIERWAEIGLDQMVLLMKAGHTTHDQVMRSLDLFGEKVLPRFR